MGAYAAVLQQAKLLKIQLLPYQAHPSHSRSYRDRFEDVEAIERRADDRSRYLRVPVDLLDVLLALVHEEQLRGDVPSALWCRVHCTSLLVVLLDREVPECDLIVRARRGKDRVLGRVPFDGSNGRTVPVEACDW